MMKSRLVLLAVLVLGVSLVFMQAASAVVMHRGGTSGMMSMDKLTQALNLTPDQVSKIQAIQSSAATQRQAVVADKSLTPEARRAKLMGIRSSTHQQVMAVLSPDQQKKYQDFLTKKKAQMTDKMSALGLTADQKAQIKTIRENSRAQIAAVRADQSLSADAKKAKTVQLFKAMRDQIRQVLTPDQRAKLDAARSNRMTK